MEGEMTVERDKREMKNKREEIERRENRDREKNFGGNKREVEEKGWMAK